MNPQEPAIYTIRDETLSFRPPPPANQPVAELPMTGDVVALLEQAHRARASVEGIALVTKLAIDATTSIHEHSRAAFAEAVEKTLAFRDEERDAESQELVAGFTAQQLQIAQFEIHAYEMAAVMGIAEQLKRLYENK